MPSNKADLEALRSMIAEAETILTTTKLPQGRAERAGELLSAAVKLSDELLKSSPAATLGAKGGRKDRRARAGVFSEDCRDAEKAVWW